ncbi:putative nuclease of restriction endonuclease-like (RecB) superfamily [Stenotrophomonas maltophilia]|uniref:PDDEXK nuclease domain-containing protein n=1 Tax=Stenotrophomonas chelatiphaga TaxID=517011 RepID=UPI000F4C0F0B|nr:PDDEXK nuclease domain-containing protein [Stenotrophomonas chelatiphaga]MCS4232307.1 putative nuclease of restriction endonuclease-like (RecB) superfamily [Stenotrophomonas chelatiphaga]ROQ41920.1 putative nuclease of restriction endonuclease-like (RecB) superfamily [Stenotrophomonas maltophilia]
MTHHPIALITPPEGYADWLDELKHRINSAQQRAALAVNRELVLLYWEMGRDILVRQSGQGWGSKVIDRLAHDLRLAFPHAKGFSPRNLKYMRAFADAWPDPAFVQEVLAQLPWYHQLTLLEKLSTAPQRIWYANQAIQHNWLRSVLALNIEGKLLERTGSAVTNFELRLPKAHSDLARETLKDPYRFDFLAVGREASERELEDGLVRHATDFLLELGAGFAFVGRQVLIEVAGEEFFIDLLFYHLHLRCYVVVELKAGKFKPEHLGQLGFYLTAVNQQKKRADDNPTLGLLLCKERNKVVAEYALSENAQPMGVAEYKVLGPLPGPLQTSLPSIEQLEKELADGPTLAG